MVRQPAALGLLLPFLGIAVAVEDDALVVAQGALDVVDGGRLELLAGLAFHLIGEFLQRLGHGRVQRHVHIRQVLGTAGHTELELVAREGKGARAVAVGVVLDEVRQHVHAEIHGYALGRGVVVIVDERLHNRAQLVAEEHGHDGRRRLVGAETVVVAGARRRHAQKLLILVDRLNNAGEEYEEAQVLHGVLARIEQVAATGGDGPIVVLARPVDGLEGLLVLQAHQAVVAGQQLHLLHGEQVLVHRAVRLGEDGRQLVLGRGHLVVLGLRGNAERPQLVVELLHELVHCGTDGAEVMLLQFLALYRRIAEQRAAREHDVEALLVVLLGDEEVLLLGAEGRGHAVGRIVAEQVEHAAALGLDGFHGAQKRRLLVERLAGVAAEGRGDAEHLVLDEGVGGGIPGGVAAGLEGGAQAAGGEAGGIGLALDEFLAGEGHDGAAVIGGIDEAVVLLGSDARQRLEPMSVVGGALLDGPLFHGVGDDVGHVLVQRRAFLDSFHQLLVGGLRQTLAHHMLVEHHGAVQIGHFRHNGFAPHSGR